MVVSNSHGATASDNAELVVLRKTDFVQRELPKTYSPGLPVMVLLHATPMIDVAVYALEDAPPLNWAVSSLSDGGSYDAVAKRVKFGPFFDALPRTFSFFVTPPPDAAGPGQFGGRASADGASSPIGGDQEIGLAPRHPADRNPGDFRITIDELTAYGAAWRSGVRWLAELSPIPIDYVTRAGFLWKNGENYIFNLSIPEAPLCWEARAAGGLASVRPQEWQPELDPPRPAFAKRAIPEWVEPRTSIAVEITVDPGARASVYAVYDQGPAGWTVAAISHEGVFDATIEAVRWGPFLDHAPRMLRCQVSSPATPFDRRSFLGLVSIDGVSIPVTGPQEVAAVTRLSSLVRLPDGRLRMDSSAWIGERAVVEVSPDLRRWTTLGVFTNREGAVTFVDPGALGQARRFYRVLRP